jgi:hypothetical protein
MSKSITDWESLKSELAKKEMAGLLTIEDKLMISEQNSATMQTMMGFARILGWTQIWTRNCEVFNAASYFWGKVKQNPEKLKEMKNRVDKGFASTQNSHFISIIQEYIDKNTFSNPDEVLNFIIQCVLQDYLNQDSTYKDTIGEDIKLDDSAITGKLESKTKKAIRYFKYKTNLWKTVDAATTGPVDFSVIFETDIENETYTSEFLKKIIEYLNGKEKDGIQVTVLGTASENIKNAINPKITTDKIIEYLKETFKQEFGITDDMETWMAVTNDTKVEFVTKLESEFTNDPNKLEKVVDELKGTTLTKVILFNKVANIPEDKKCRYNTYIYGYDEGRKKLLVQETSGVFWGEVEKKDVDVLLKVWKKGNAGKCTTLSKFVMVEGLQTKNKILVEVNINRIKNLMGLK